MDNKDKLINLSYLKEISNGNDEFIIELIDIFFEQIPEYQILLQDLYEKEDWLNIGKIAHKAKSSILMMGLNPHNDLNMLLNRLFQVKLRIYNYNNYLFYS